MAAPSVSTARRIKVARMLITGSTLKAVSETIGVCITVARTDLIAVAKLCHSNSDSQREFAFTSTFHMRRNSEYWLDEISKLEDKTK